MKILLDGYFDHNLGDDLMLTLAADGLREHELYVPSDKIKLENAAYTTTKSGFDAYLKVTGSGFLIHNNLGMLYRLRDMRRENKYAPVKAVINCNISDFINSISAKIVNKQLSQYDFITARDSFSYDYIRGELPKLRCEEYPDIVFSLPDSMIPDVACEGLLGIAVHSGADAEGLAAVADGYIAETGKNVLLLCFDTGMENDEAAAKKVLANSKSKDKIKVVLYESIQDMLIQMKRCKIILGIRFHSIVLAARMGIPFVPIVYSTKTLHALGSLQYKKTMWQAENFNSDEVLKRVLTEEPYELPKDTIRLASEHVIKFSEYLKSR